MLTRYVPSWLKGSEKQTPRPLAIRGTEGVVVSYAKCCRPIPGDPVVGAITAGRGIVIHVENCKNAADFRHKPEKCINVQWEKEVAGEFPVDIRVDVANKRGILATIAAAIAELGANIENVTIEDRDGKFSAISFTVDVRDRQHLAAVIRRVRAIDLVAKIARTRS